VKFLIQSLLRILPITYIIWIWLQSAHFNPSSIEHVFYDMDYRLYLLIGGTLEMAHLILFGLLYLFIIVALLTFGKLTRKKEMLALILAISYSFIDEIHQYYVPYRSFSIIDMIKNLIGIWFFWWLINKTYYKRDSKIGKIFRRVKSKKEVHL
jgi:polysaccharide biosynthesis protein VpsQ